MKRLSKALLLFAVIVFLLNRCTESLEDGLPGNDSDSTTYHPTGWKDNPQHGNNYSENEQNCKACHGEDLKGGAQVYHAKVVIMAGAAPMRMPLMKILIPAWSVMEDQLQPARIVTTADGPAPMAKNTLQIPITAKHATVKT